MDPTCQEGTILSGGACVIVWGSWCNTGSLVRLEFTLTGGRFVSILSDHLYPLMFIVHYDAFKQFQEENESHHITRVSTEWRPINTLLIVDTSIGHLNIQICMLLKKSRMPCNLLFKKDLYYFTLLWVYELSCRIDTLIGLWTTLQVSWCNLRPRYLQIIVESTPNELLYFYMLVEAVHDI